MPSGKRGILPLYHFAVFPSNFNAEGSTFLKKADPSPPVNFLALRGFYSGILRFYVLYCKTVMKKATNPPRERKGTRGTTLVFVSTAKIHPVMPVSVKNTCM